jgi:hypothetical protein
VTHPAEDVDERLARLAGATAAVSPSAGFERRVMARLGAELSRTWLDELVPYATRRLPIAAVAAVLALAWAYRSADAVDEALAASYGVAVVEW